MSAKTEYSYLKQKEELFDLFPEFTGDWEKDKKVFIKYWENNTAALKNIEIFDVDEDYFYGDEYEIDNPM